MSADPKPIDTEWFKSRGFDDKSLKQLAKNAELAERIQKVYTSENVTESSETKSSLIYTWCTLPGQELIDQTETVAKYIFSGKFLNKQQLKLAEGYFTAHKFDFDTAEFEKVTGVGVVITEADIKAHVEKYTTDNLDKLKKADYRVNYPEFLNGLKDSLPLANPSDILKAATEYVKEKFAAELKEASDPKKKDKKKEETAEAKPEGEDEFAEFQKVDLSKLLARDLADAMNDAETLAKHKAATGGKVITRFPPEPNGILHIGHSRAIRFNFSISGLYKGECNLRYDDTNPEKEKKEYMDMIEDNVKWMGFQPTQILHASQYFDQIYDWTVELIKKGKAYICKLPVDVMRKYKDEKIPSPYRDTDPAINLREFELMRAGYYAEGEAVCRAKIDYQSNHTTMRDPVLYRILYTPHPVSGTKYCIYPMYDYAHPLSDSIENITHSCCTLEFETRRDLYYWPLKELNLYKPFVWEFSRLNITYTLTSKRKILQLIADNVVKGWDDPRLYTLNGLRRRGIPIEALNEFLDRVPVTRRGNDNFIQLNFFDHVIKGWLDKHCPRSLAVLDPIALEITNIPEGESTVVQAPVFPNDPSKGTYAMKVERHVFVDAKDVREQDAPGFFGIAPGKLIRLKYGPAIRITSIGRQGKNLVVKGERLSADEAAKEPTIKGVLNWLSKSDAHTAEFRQYDLLFTVPKPELDAEDAEARKREINFDSAHFFPKGLINKGLVDQITKDSRFQFERLGFFSVDYDTNFGEKKFVFNRILESQSKPKEEKAKAPKAK